MASVEKRWDVFLSYASPEREQVERLALYLENVAGLRVFLDKWCLVPGQPFIPELRDGIRASRSCAVFIGKSGTRPWQNKELQAALDQAVGDEARPGDEAFRVFLVLLPDAGDPPRDSLPAFIDLHTWVDFRTSAGLEDAEALGRLVAGVRGTPPGKPDAPPRWLTTTQLPQGARPTGIAVSDGTVFVADHAAGQVMRLEAGAVVGRCGGLTRPHHLIVLDEQLIVADTNRHRLACFDLRLEPQDASAVLDPPGLRRPHGLATNFPGEFYVADADNHRILRVRHGKVVAAAGRAQCESGSGPGEFSVPCGVAASLDCIFVADTYNHRIQVLGRNLDFIASFGVMGDGMGQMAYPVAVATWHRWIVISDEHNKRLQLWRRESQALPFEVACVSADLLGARLGSPFGLCFDADGTLFVSDRQRANVLRIEFERMLPGVVAPDR